MEFEAQTKQGCKDDVLTEIKTKQAEEKMKSRIDAVNLGKIIRKYRKAKKMTQADLAGTANINESYLSNIECGNCFISISKFLSICDALKIDPAELIREFDQIRVGKTSDHDKDGNKNEDNPDWFLGRF